MTLTQEFNTAQLTTSLKSILTKYLEKNPRLTLTGLAKDNPRVGKTTLYNLVNSSSIKKPSNRTILGILEAINPGKSWDSIAKQYQDFPEIYKIVAQHCQSTYQGNSKAIIASQGHCDALSDEEIFRPTIMSQSDAGVSEETIEKEFGRTVLQQVEKLTHNGTLLKRNRKYYGSSETINTNQNTAQRLATNLLKKCYDLDAFINTQGEDISEKKNNELRILYKTDVNLKHVLPKVSKAILKCREEILEIINSPDASGDEIFWSVLASDSLLKSPPFQGRNKGENLQ